jgi:uncharacterized protein
VKLFERRDARLLEMLAEAGRNAARAGSLLREMLQDFPERAHLAHDLLVCEHEGDRMAHDVIYRVTALDRRSPFDPRDVHDLVSAIDDVVDFAEQTADSLVLYAIEAPMEQAQELAIVLARASAEVARALERLESRSELNDSLVQIHELENEGDRVSREAIGSLFAAGIDPMVVIRWKDIFDTLEQAIDACETVAHVLEGISLKRR